METVEHNGKVYEIGKYYLFKDLGDSALVFGELSGIIKGSIKYPFAMKGGDDWEIIEEVPASGELGSITEVPIDLIDGNAYMFDHSTYKNEIGLYCVSDGHLRSVLWSVEPFECTNIREMLVKL